MLEWIFDTLRAHCEIAIFLTLALGFWVGRLKIRSFSLGVVTSTLLAGVLVGQLGIDISPHVKSTFFLMFLFAVGYAVGPQFFRGLKGDGVRQVVFAVFLCVAVLATAVVTGKLMGYTVGTTAGLLSGASTISAVLGVATDSINQLPLAAEQKREFLDAMPIAYAITYLFGTAGSAWILASLGPKLLGVNLEEECRKYEAELGGGLQSAEQHLSAYRELTVRAIRLKREWFGKTIDELERTFPMRTFVQRLRSNGKIVEAKPNLRIPEGAVIALAGRRNLMLEREASLGTEVDDRELVDVEVEALDVVITNKALAGKTLGELAEQELAGAGRGVFLRKILRSGVQLPLTFGLPVDRGDTLTLVGAKPDVERLAPLIGYVDRPTEQTDMVVMGAGITLGALAGAITIHLGGVPLSLSTSGGALIAGLVCGWLRSVNRTFGRIPGPALWVFNNIGLNIFIAVVGISAGPKFVAGLMSNGLSLFVAGLIVTTVPLVLGVLAGKYLFKFKAPIVLGACAGARTTTAALGAIEAEAKSSVPALGYTVTYAVGNTLLTIWGVVIVLLMT
ncbi:MAG TPA: aspartate-alanine antiporter [Steroidobacteraceae bacterium]|nr:aspartate-alanine antiporter [Steroidobacteraceae bacterium]